MRIFEGRTSKDRIIIYADMFRAGRHPMQVFMLFLCTVSATPLLFGYTVAGSIEEELPAWESFTWGLCLLLGSAGGLIGAYWRGKLTTALTIERASLALVGCAACVYAIVIIVSGGVPRIVSAAIIFAFGLSFLRRARDIGKIIHMAVQLKKVTQ